MTTPKSTIDKMIDGLVIAVGLLALLALWYAGWSMRDASARAELANSRTQAILDAAEDARKWQTRLDAANSQLQDLKQAYAQERDAAQAKGEVETARLLKAEQDALQANQVLTKELKHAKKRADEAGRPSCDLSAEWVRLYNKPLLAASGVGGGQAPSGAAQAPAGASDAAQQSAGVNEWDVSELHAENARRWQSCRDQLNAVIDWSLALNGTASSVAMPE